MQQNESLADGYSGSQTPAGSEADRSCSCLPIPPYAPAILHELADTADQRCPEMLTRSLLGSDAEERGAGEKNSQPPPSLPRLQHPP